MAAADPTTVAESGGREATRESDRHKPFASQALFVLCLFAAAFLFRLWPIWKVHFWDEAVYLQNAEVICCGKANYSELSSRPPLLSLIFAAAFKVWHHAYAASIVSAILNALGPVFLFLGGRRLAGRNAAIIAVLLLAFSPFFISGNVGNSLLTDSPALTFILLCLWLSVESIEREGAAWGVLAGLAGALAVLTRFASLPTVAIVSLLMLRSKPWLRGVVRFGIGFAAAVVPYLMWSRIRYGGFLTTLEQGWRNVAGSSEPAGYYLQHFFDVFPYVTVLGLGLWLVAVVADQRGAQSRTAWPGHALLWLWVLADFGYFSAITHKELRYILPLAPAVFLLCGTGLAVLFRGRDAKKRVIGAAVLVALLGYSFVPSLQRFRSPLVAPFISEEKDVSDFLNARARPGATLYTNFNSPVFGYYTSLPTKVLTEQDAGFYKVFPANMPADGYLIFYKNIDKDPRQDWIESNPEFQVFQDFPSLTVYEYRASGK